MENVFRIQLLAVIFSGNKVLLVQKKPGTGRKLAGKWLFPGTKWRAFENQEEALVSAIKEDIGLDIWTEELMDVGTTIVRERNRKIFTTTLWFCCFPKKGKDFNITKKYEAAEWLDIREVYKRISDDRLRREWFPPEIQVMLLG